MANLWKKLIRKVFKSSSYRVNNFSNEFSSGSEELKAKNSMNKNDPTNAIKKLITNQNNSLTIKSFIFKVFWLI